MTSTSPSSVGRSITSALAAAIPSFNGGFLRSSTPSSVGIEGAPERSSTDQAQQNSGTEKASKSSQEESHSSAAERLSPEVRSDEASVTNPSSALAPSNQPSLQTSTGSASTSYLPSPASISSFFSSGSKPKSTSQAPSTPLQTTTPPPTESANYAPNPTTSSKAPEKETSTPSVEASTSLSGTTGGSEAPLLREPPVSNDNPSSAKSVSPATSTPPVSSLTALMNTAVPYLTPASRKPSKPVVSPEVGPVEKPAVPPQLEGAQGTESGKDRVTSASGASLGMSTSAADQTPSEGPTVSNVTFTSLSSGVDGPAASYQRDESPNPSSIAAPPGFSAPPSSSSQDNSLNPCLTSPQGPQPVVSPSETPPNTSHIPQPEKSAQETPPSTSSQEAQPANPAREIPPGTSPQPVTSPATVPADPSEGPQPGAAAREIPTSTSSQAPHPPASAQGTSPGTSYLSLPSFLPSWSTITAQLPSIPSAPFTSKEPEATPGTKAPRSGAPSVSGSGRVADVGLESAPGQRPNPPMSGSVSESGPPSQPPQNPGTSGSVPFSSARTEPPSVASPSFASEAPNKHAADVSKPGGKQQELPRRELDPPGAVAADEIAAGIAGVFGPVTREADKQVEAALRSQEKLALSIDRLTKGLDKLLEESPQPLVAQQAARLAHIRKRVQSLASTLKVIQGRIDSMNWALDRKSLRGPFSRARSATAPNSPHSYQPGIAPFQQIRQHVAKSRVGRGEGDHPQLPTSWRPEPSGSTGRVAQAGSSRGGEMADLSRIAQGRPSSKSPDKGHRRAMSHDVRFSTALSSKR
ncbi:hypothetical protein KFL_000710320 [Klebsormidium nitens]|uniref:Biogenesis of lysosome-related organelles complex 1 subunit 7 n=1 Tax=Klebsormidium nitens TaxID=105231 RepID=A0A1Y1HX65_KLENI|nr:hypothetical protein KFL_000710320 [Klebsormidium nitens]|eukprot:GAQ81127.1 hypothetical protein KFL_000710320 [Klebsormidium nitens]